MDLKAGQNERTEITALIGRAMQGDDSVWNAVYEKTHRYVYFIALKSLRNEQDAQDITHDVYIQVIRSIGQLYSADSFYGWLRRIIFSKCMDFIKKKKPALEEDTEVDLESVVQVGEAFLPESILDSAETRRMVMELIDALPDAQRQSVLFYYYDEMTVDQIAALMECSPGTVKSRLNYARAKIKAGVEEHGRRGTKLYGVSALPILTILLHEQAQAMEIPFALGAGLAPILGGTLSTIGTTTTAGTGAVITKTAGTLSAKFIAVIVAGVIAVGGGLTAWVLTNDNQPPEEAPVAIVSETPTESEFSDMSEKPGSSTAFDVSETESVAMDAIELISCGNSPGENAGETIYKAEVHYALATADTAQIELMMNYTPRGDAAFTSNEWEAVTITKGSDVVSLINTYPGGLEGIEYEGVIYPTPTKGRVIISVDGTELVYQDIDFVTGTAEPASNAEEQALDVTFTDEQLAMLKPLEQALIDYDMDAAFPLLTFSGIQDIFHTLPKEFGNVYKIDDNGKWFLSCNANTPEDDSGRTFQITLVTDYNDGKSYLAEVYSHDGVFSGGNMMTHDYVEGQRINPFYNAIGVEVNDDGIRTYSYEPTDG